MTVTASSMAVDYTRIIREIGEFYGDRDSDNWDSDFSTAVDDCIRTALNNVIHPMVIPMFGMRSHQWSWLRPVWKMSTAEDQRRYSLPIDFERFVGNLHYDGEDYAYESISQLPATRLMQLPSSAGGGRKDCACGQENTGIPSRPHPLLTHEPYTGRRKSTSYPLRERVRGSPGPRTLAFPGCVLRSEDLGTPVADERHHALIHIARVKKPLFASPQLRQKPRKRSGRLLRSMGEELDSCAHTSQTTGRSDCSFSYAIAKGDRAVDS